LRKKAVVLFCLWVLFPVSEGFVGECLAFDTRKPAFVEISRHAVNSQVEETERLFDDILESVAILKRTLYLDSFLHLMDGLYVAVSERSQIELAGDRFGGTIRIRFHPGANLVCTENNSLRLADGSIAWYGLASHSGFAPEILCGHFPAIVERNRKPVSEGNRVSNIGADSRSEGSRIGAPHYLPVELSGTLCGIGGNSGGLTCFSHLMELPVVDTNRDYRHNGKNYVASNLREFYPSKFSGELLGYALLSIGAAIVFCAHLSLMWSGWRH